MNTNKISQTYVLELLNDDKSIKQIKNIKKQLKQFMLKTNNIIPNSDSNSLYQNGQKIFEIISNNLSEKINYFIDSNGNYFYYEIFISCLLEKIKARLSKIKKNGKSIDSSLFHKINKNTIKKIQSIIIVFMTSFYDFYENDPSFTNIDEIFEAIINKNAIIEESFLISCIKIIIMINKYIDKNIMKNTFNEKIINNTSSIKELVLLLIKILNKLILIKKNIDFFNFGENADVSKNNSKNAKGLYNFSHFELFVSKVYDANEPDLTKLLFDIIFDSNLNFFFPKITVNDDLTKILLNSLTFEKNIRNKLIKCLNKSPYELDMHSQKDLLKAINSNDSLTILFNYISVDLKNKKYTSSSDLLEELKILYTFSLLIHSNDVNTQKIIIQLLIEDFNTKKEEDDIEIHYNKFITEVYDLSKKIQKYKYQIYNLILLIFDSMKSLRKMISQIYFNNIEGNAQEYLEMKKNVKFETLFINNLSNSAPDVINNFFNFLYSLKIKEYLPSDEILLIITQLPYFTDYKSVEALIENFKILIDINYLSDNKGTDLMNESAIFNTSGNKLKRIESKNDKNSDLYRFNEFIENVYKNYINVLFSIITEVKDNINSAKYKSPFDNDVSITDIINTNYNEENKQFISCDLLSVLLDYLNVILKDKKMLKHFLSLKFLDFFPFLVNNETYNKIAYKIIEIFLKATNKDDKNHDKNKQQILTVLNRFYLIFSKDAFLEEDGKKKYNELYKLKELLLMTQTIKIYFDKKQKSSGEYSSIENLNEKIINFYFYYPEYLVQNSKQCIKQYNDEYHSLIKKYLMVILELILISNQNIINKNDYFSPNNLKKKIKISIDNMFKFYTSNSFKRNDYILDIIKHFIDKSFNFYLLEDTCLNNTTKLFEEKLSEEDFTIFYINKYKIKPEVLIDNINNKNKNIISNFCIQSPKTIIILLKELFKYNVYLNQILDFILFLCKVNQQNIIFLLKHNLLKALLKIVKEMPSTQDVIFKIFNLCFKFLQKEDVTFVFEQLIKLLNNAGSNNNKDLVKQILFCITNTLRILSIASNGYSKGIILTRYKIRQPNVYNICEINNLNFCGEDFLNINNNILIKQEIYFYKSLKTRKLLLLRLEKEIIQSNERLSFKEKINKNDYIEISFKNYQIKVSENDEQIELDDLSNYNSIFIDNDNDKKSEYESYFKINENNTIIYIFKEKSKKLYIYINGIKVFTYAYSFIFTNNIKLKIGFPLDLVKEVDDRKFKNFSHIKLKSLKIFLQKKETNEIIQNIYQLVIGNISCDYLFADELTNFKLDENTKLVSKYNAIYSARINSIFHKCFIKSQLYRKLFFCETYLTNSLDYLFRFEKYLFILLNSLNLDKIIFNELISLLSTYLMINENFIPKFFLKEEFSSSLYFSLFRNAKFIDKETIDNLLSVVLINNSKKIISLNNNVIINTFLDIRLFDLINNQTKYDLISLISSKIVQKYQSIVNNIFIVEKLSKILMLCLFNSKNDIDELIINIIFDIFIENPKNNSILNIIEEVVYILFNFDTYSTYHLSKFKNGRNSETSKIIYEYFNKIYNKESVTHIKELILKKLSSMSLDIKKKEKLNRIVSAYTPPILVDTSNNNNLDRNDSNSMLNFDEEDEDEDNIFQISEYPFQKVRSLSFSYKDEVAINKNYDRTFTGRSEMKKLTVNNPNTKLLLNKSKKCNPSKFYNYDISDYSSGYQPCRQQSSIRPMDDVIIFKGVISGRKSAKSVFKKQIEKKKSVINISITNEDKDNCIGECHLCIFIRKILISLFKREINFGIYKNYLLHCISEVFIMNKNLDFKVNFSYHLMKREGPSRIRKKFNIRIDKLLNQEYDRNAFENRALKKAELSKNKNINDKDIKEKSVIFGNNNKEVIYENELEKIFLFYENKKKYISENLLNFFNLGQIYNINLISKLFDFDDKFQGAFNCLLFRGLSYINAVLILGRNKIYILSSVNLSLNNVLYDAHIPIAKRFWILKEHNDILKEHCQYLKSYDLYENKVEENTKNKNYNQNKKKLFEKTLKGFWLYSFYYVEINEIHKRRFLHQNNSIEIFLKNGKNYYLSFNLGIRDKIVKAIIINIKQSHLSKNIAFFIKNNYDSIRDFQKNDNSNYILNKKTSNEEINDNLSNMTYEIQNESSMKNENMIFIMDSNLFIDKSKKYDKQNFYKNIFKKNVKKTKYCLATITDVNEILDKSFDKWTNGHLDTYSYLMILNTISGRTYNDIAQYPVYPWIIQNYTSNVLDLNNSETYRDFLYPIYAQDDETRENLKHKYDCFEEEQKEFRYHSGSHYSNAGFVCYYLIRIKPYSQLAAEVQGEYFDTTDRLFFNIESFYKVSEKYQELIPDFFNIPEIFINPNNFYFGLTSDKKNIDNVVLPPWASHSPRLFCKIMRKSLESQYVSTHINEWIDLIFGYKRKGVDAEKYYNALREVCSAFNPIKDCEDDIEIDQKINELCEMGIDPIQLFTKPHHKREKHQKIKAFFGKSIYLRNFKITDERVVLKNFENNSSIKEMNKYYEYCFENISKGEGGLSSFRMCYEEESQDCKDIINNSIYFIAAGKKTLLPPSYKNYLQWNNNNSFYLIKPFGNMKYKFIIHHMRKQIINFIRITRDGSFIIIGYSNGIIEKYKLARIWGPKYKKLNSVSKKSSHTISFKESSNSLKEKDSINSINTINENPSAASSISSSLRKESNDKGISNNNNVYENIENNIMDDNLDVERVKRKKENSLHTKKGLFNALFGTRNRKKTAYVKSSIRKIKDNEIGKNDLDEIDGENRQIIEVMEKSISNAKVNNSQVSNEILFDTQIPISTSNIINSDCIILNNKTGKFIQYNGCPEYSEYIHEKEKYDKNQDNNKIDNNNLKDLTTFDIPGFEFYSKNKNNFSKLINKQNNNNSLSKHYIIFLINSSSRILSEISLIEICEPYSFMLVVDKLNNLYIYDFNTLDLIKHIDCSIYFHHKIKYVSICPYTGDFILASYYRIILMSINGVFITQINDIKSKINHCFITSIHKTSSDLYLFSAHENGFLKISKLVNNLNGFIYNMNKCSTINPKNNELLNSKTIDVLNNKYDPIRIQNISEVYQNAYNTNQNYSKMNDKNNKYFENNNYFSTVFDTLIDIECSQYPIKFIKLSQDLSCLYCINSKNNLITLNYEDLLNEQKKAKKNMSLCEKCKGLINSKIVCAMCGKKVCPNCKKEKIIAECSLKTPKPICEECSQLINKNNQNLYDI